MTQSVQWYQQMASQLGYTPQQIDIPGLQAATTPEALWDLVQRNTAHIHFFTREQSELYYQHQETLNALSKYQKYMKLPEIKAYGENIRRLVQPVFKIQFDTAEQMRLRLDGSLIFIGPDLYYIASTFYSKDQGDYLLITQDYRGRQGRIWYNDPAVDLRAPEPQYIMYSGQPAYLTRKATRHQRQGLDRSNTGVKFIGETRFHPMDRTDDVMKAFRNRDPIIWEPKLYELMAKARALTGLRLSEKVAVGLGDDDILCEYKGRTLGVVNEDTVTVGEETDYKIQWIRRDLKEIGLDMRYAP